MQWDLLQTNLLSPPILFFLLGLLAVWVRSDLDIPEALEKGLSLYLMMAIGLQGGHKLMAASPDANGIAALGLGVVAAFVLPFATFAVLRRRLAPDDAAGVAASYGSVSAVTFVTAAALLIASNIPYSGHMVAALALMESPALVSSLMLVAHRGERRSFGTLLLEALTNGAVLLLIGSLLIGALSGDRGGHGGPLRRAPFRGLLSLPAVDGRGPVGACPTCVPAAPDGPAVPPLAQALGHRWPGCWTCGHVCLAKVMKGSTSRQPVTLLPGYPAVLAASKAEPSQGS